MTHAASLVLSLSLRSELLRTIQGSVPDALSPLNHSVFLSSLNAIQEKKKKDFQQIPSCVAFIFSFAFVELHLKNAELF